MNATLKSRLISTGVTLVSLLAIAQEGLADNAPGLGGGIGAPAPTNVPEPGTLALFAAAGAAAFAVRWIHTRRKGD